MREVDVSVCVPALSVMMNVILDTSGAIVGIAEAFSGRRIGVYVEVARSTEGCEPRIGIGAEVLSA
jgi:hypothetical protein